MTTKRPPRPALWCGVAALPILVADNAYLLVQDISSATAGTLSLAGHATGTVGFGLLWVSALMSLRERRRAVGAGRRSEDAAGTLPGNDHTAVEGTAPEAGRHRRDPEPAAAGTHDTP